MFENLTDRLESAFKQLKGEHYRLLLTGNGEQEQALRKLAATDSRILWYAMELCFFFSTDCGLDELVTTLLLSQ